LPSLLLRLKLIGTPSYADCRSETKALKLRERTALCSKENSLGFFCWFRLNFDRCSSLLRTIQRAWVWRLIDKSRGVSPQLVSLLGSIPSCIRRSKQAFASVLASNHMNRWCSKFMSVVVWYFPSSFKSILRTVGNLRNVRH